MPKRIVSIKDDMIMKFVRLSVEHGESEEDVLSLCKELRKHTWKEVKQIIDNTVTKMGWK